MRPVIAISFPLTLFCCKKKADEASIWVNATVLNTNGISCRTPVLDFSEDSTKVHTFTGNSELTYVVKGFPSELNTQGKKVLVQIAIPRPEEYFTCITLGPNWPELKVLTANAR